MKRQFPKMRGESSLYKAGTMYAIYTAKIVGRDVYTIYSWEDKIECIDTTLVYIGSTMDKDGAELVLNILDYKLWR